MDDVSLTDLDRELNGVVDWFRFGVALGLPAPVLQATRKDRRDTGDCRMEMLTTWKDREIATWPKIVQALKDIGLIQLSKTLSKKYCGPANTQAQKSKPPPPPSTRQETQTKPPPLQPSLQDDTSEEELGFHNLPKIRQYLYPIPLKGLFDLGLILGIDYTKLKTLKDGKELEFFLDEMIAAWIRKEDCVTCATWEVLVNALRNEMIGQTDIASKIETIEITT